MVQISQQDELSQLYNNELELADKLQKLLIDEEAALRSRDVQLINNCTEKKSTLLENFESSELKRQELYQAAEPVSVEAVSKRHEQLKVAMEAIHHQNMVNAGIVKVSQDFTHQLLNIVRGISHDQSTYDSLGKTLNTSGNQSLAKV